MDKLFLSIDEIKELVDHVKRQDMESLEIKQDNFQMKIVGGTQPVVMTPVSVPVQVETSQQPEPVVSGNLVKSPIVGTFYQSPSPEKPAYIKVGDQVKVGETLFIIESMKLMNEVVSEYTGKITEILVKDGQTVEYGQPILTIE